MKTTDTEEGFSAADALVGVMIVSATIAAALQAQGVARRLAAASIDYRRAAAVGEYLAEAAPGGQGGAGFTSGQTASVGWTVREQPLPGADETPLKLCRRSIEMTVGAGGRRMRLDRIVPCAEPTHG